MSTEPVRIFKALSDETRLRILGLLGHQELSVNDMAEILESTQSRVSRHINVLREAGFLKWRKEGTWSFYRKADEGEIAPEIQQAWDLVDTWSKQGTTAADDQQRLQEVLRKRRQKTQQFFGEHAEQWDSLRARICGDFVTFQSLETLIPPHLTVVDVGTGTGHFLLQLARVVDCAIGVDHSTEMLEVARRNAAEAKRTNVELRFGEMESLPFSNNEVDAVFAGLVLHHAADPTHAIAEMARIVKPGGTVTIIDLMAHEEEWMREELAHTWLGFDPFDLERWFHRAGINTTRWMEGISTPDVPGKNSPPVNVKSVVFTGRK